MKITQRLPNFFSGFIPEKHQVSSLEEMKAIPFIKQWMDNEKFFQLSISRSDKNQALLMCELDGGEEFWVIAYLAEYQDFDLPVWEYKSTK